MNTSKQWTAGIAALVIVLAGAIYLTHHASITPSPAADTNMASSTLFTDTPATTTATAATNTNKGVSVKDAVVTEGNGSGITITSTIAPSYANDAVIPLTLSAKNIIGPVDIYLFTLNHGAVSVVATLEVPKSNFSSAGAASVKFDLVKTRASTSIAPGAYEIGVCDMGVPSATRKCASTSGITITGKSTVTTLDPQSVPVGGTLSVIGSGFASNSKLILDGKAFSPLSTVISSDGTVIMTAIPPSIPPGTHTLAVGSVGGTDTSAALSFTVVAAVAPVINAVVPSSAKAGEVMTVNGSNFSKSYPTKIELMQNNTVVATFDPSKTNAFAISADGTMLKFIIDQNTASTLSPGGYSLRASNSASLKSSALSFTFVK